MRYLMLVGRWRVIVPCKRGILLLRLDVTVAGLTLSNLLLLLVDDVHSSGLGS
jgi:hypothetical protein